MHYPEIRYSKNKSLIISAFKDMDTLAIEDYKLPIELMMENAGLHLAQLVSGYATKNSKINIGIGNGNNGGGGLVAARKLAAWDYQVNLDLSSSITKDLPAMQFDRAQRFGVYTTAVDYPDIWIDAYLGFSQRLPLYRSLISTLEKVNSSSALKISLDIPTGFSGDRNSTYFEADKVLTLAAPKSILFDLPFNTEIFIADLGLPKEVYEKFGIDLLPFDVEGIIKLKY